MVTVTGFAPSDLYFMTDGARLKIGVTTNPKARLGAVQTGNPERCSYLLLMELNNAKEIERLLHERLDYCVSPSDKEWFDVSYDAAQTHLFALGNEWNVPGGRELPLASPQVPRLADHAEAFEKWLFEVWYRESSPPPVSLQELWDNLHGHYLSGEEPPTTASISASFRQLAAKMEEIARTKSLGA